MARGGFRSKLAVLLQRAIRDYERLLRDPHASPIDIARAHDAMLRVDERLIRSYQQPQPKGGRASLTNDVRP